MGIDRTSKYVHAELYSRMIALIASVFLSHFLSAIPYKVHTIPTDNGIQFAYRATDKSVKIDPFKRVYIAHRLTQVSHFWTNVQV